MTPVSLTAFAPDDCGHGHILRGPGRLRPVGAMLVGWHPCDCPAAQKQRGAHGHIRVRCTACLDEGIDTSFYDPPCGLAG